MGFYSTLHINITFKQNTPSCVTNFFTKGIRHEALPTFLYEMGFNFTNKINLTTPDMLLTEYGAKTYTKDKPNNNFYLQLTQEFDLDSYILSVYPFITFVASYAEDNAMAGYIKDEMNKYDAFAIKDGIVHWQQKQKINIDTNKKLDYFELVAIGTKIKYSHGSETEINEWMNIFDKNVPYPNGSSLFFFTEKYDARKIEIKDYNPTVNEVVEKCLNYKSIQL
jgi:hypothetical protein